MMVPQSSTYRRTSLTLGAGGRPEGGAGWAEAPAQAITARNAASRFKAMACPPIAGRFSVVVMAHDAVILQQLDIEQTNILLAATVDEIARRVALGVGHV